MWWELEIPLLQEANFGTASDDVHLETAHPVKIGKVLFAVLQGQPASYTTIFLRHVSRNSVQSAPTVINACWDIRYFVERLTLSISIFCRACNAKGIDCVSDTSLLTLCVPPPVNSATTTTYYRSNSTSWLLP